MYSHSRGGVGSRRGRGGASHCGSTFVLGHKRKTNKASFENEDAASTVTRSDSDGDDGRDITGMLDDQPVAPPAGLSCSALLNFLQNVDGRNYGQLKELSGKTFHLTAQMMPASDAVTVRFLRIQPDPFAPGSQVCVTVPAPFSTKALLHSSQPLPPSNQIALPDLAGSADAVQPEDTAWRRVAAEDFILRCVQRGLAHQQGSFAVQILHVSQHVLPRSTVRLVESPAGDAAAPNGFVCVFLRVKLPGRGRHIDSQGIQRILFTELLPAFQGEVSKCWHKALWAHVTSVCDQEWLRRQLPSAGLAGFIVDGAVLPRASGDSDLPLNDKTVVPFSSPASLSVSFQLPYSGRTIWGAGLPHGLTLIAGGGFHGKSTLLRALELGVYNHIPDDGRTFVVVDPTAVKIRAEDRRAVSGVDISPFIRNLPFSKDTTAFSTGDASGSTSQAANIMEALELGSTALLLDEDTSATNFMYRDALMEQLVPPAEEPITSFVHRARDLIQQHKVSIIMVVGGSGQYFPMANVVLVMSAYHVRDATAKAKEIVRWSGTGNDNHDTKGGSLEPTPTAAAITAPPTDSAFHFPPQRHFQYDASFAKIARLNRQGRSLKVSGLGIERVRVGDEEIELGLVEQLVEEGQLNAIAQCLAMLYDDGSAAAEKLQCEPASSPVYPPPLWTPSLFFETKTSPLDPSASQLPPVSDYCQLICNCERQLRLARLELQTQSCYLPAGFTSLPRVFELGAALNRLRTLTTASL